MFATTNEHSVLPEMPRANESDPQPSDLRHVDHWAPTARELQSATARVDRLIAVLGAAMCPKRWSEMHQEKSGPVSRRPAALRVLFAAGRYAASSRAGYPHDGCRKLASTARKRSSGFTSVLK